MEKIIDAHVGYIYEKYGNEVDANIGWFTSESVIESKIRDTGEVVRTVATPKCIKHYVQ